MDFFEIQRCVLVRDGQMEYDAENFTVTCSDDLAMVGRRLGIDSCAEEYFVMMCFNAKGRIIALHEISHGDISSSCAHPRDVFKRALLNNAASIAIMHSHPSGDSKPSQQDIATTKRLMEAGEILGVPVIDHIILGDENYSSMKASGIIT